MIVDDEEMLKSVFANERHKRKNENSNKNMILNMSYRNIRVMVNTCHCKRLKQASLKKYFHLGLLSHKLMSPLMKNIIISVLSAHSLLTF